MTNISKYYNKEYDYLRAIIYTSQISSIRKELGRITNLDMKYFSKYDNFDSIKYIIDNNLKIDYNNLKLNSKTDFSKLRENIIPYNPDYLKACKLKLNTYLKSQIHDMVKSLNYPGACTLSRNELIDVLLIESPPDESMLKYDKCCLGRIFDAREKYNQQYIITDDIIYELPLSLLVKIRLSKNNQCINK